nr:MAG TPA: hypothetical protein [Caudoviricetes sp.]
MVISPLVSFVLISTWLFIVLPHHYGLTVIFKQKIYLIVIYPIYFLDFFNYRNIGKPFSHFIICYRCY